MKNVKLIALFSLLCLMILVPATYAMDNQTVVEASDEGNVLSDEYYFDANVENDTGNGSQDSPYKELTPDRVKDNSIIHLNNGEYQLNAEIDRTNLTVIGQDPQKTEIRYDDNVGFYARSSLNLQNLTLTHFAVSDRSDSIIKATNVIFKENIITSISTSCANTGVYLENCTFLDNHADTGGAIKINEGSLEIANSVFMNNYAKQYGGAIYVRDSIFISRNLEIINSTSKMGGAITALYSDLNLTNLTGRNNNAKYSGGVIYALFGSLSLYDSTFVNNTAQDGGALFIDEVSDFIPFNNSFTNNTAGSIAGAVYSAISRNLNPISVLNESLKNSFFNNAAGFENDVYECEAINLNYNSQNYLLIQSGPLYDSILPSSYDLRVEQMVTPVKNQGSNGNCWAFASIASLESCILKATGFTYDLSEENMKDLMEEYSSYGWQMETNSGGYDRMGHAYLVSWLGPVNESDDNYVIGEVLSPVLNSIFHIQNILFLKRTTFTDNDEIKRAIMSYGAVSTCIHWEFSTSYINGKNVYWNRYDKGANHAVAIVGWDDNYSKSNFRITPPGDGAWIIKNSWGPNSGENGYYYVSYYDTGLAPLNDPYSSYVLLFNESIKYDKNYQYDVSGRTDFFLNASNTVWYKNKFISSDNEYLAAVSTFFEKDTLWDLSIYVNGVLRHTQSGMSTSSYSTIELSNIIPLNLGDVFEVEFKITVDNEASVPISEDIIASGVPINKQLFHENISFISYDGDNWTDLYDLVWAYSTHTYKSQVACIKAFTILNEVNFTTDLTINITDEMNIVAEIINEYGYHVNWGNVIFNVGGENYTVKVVNGIARLNLTLNPGKHNISTMFNKMGYVSTQNNFTVEVPLVNTTLSVEINQKNPVNVTAKVFNQYGYAVKYGNVTFNINGDIHTVNLSDGIACLNYIFKDSTVYNILAVFNPIDYYNSSANQTSLDLPVITTHVTIDVNNHNPINITATVLNEYGYRIDSGNVTFMLDDGSSYTVNVSDGSASISHIFKTFGKHNVLAVFNSIYYNSSSNFTEFDVSLIDTSVELIVDNLYNPVNIHAIVKDQYGNLLNFGKVIFSVDKTQYEINVVNGSADLTHIFNKIGLNSINAVFNGLEYYYASSNKDMEINVKSTIIASDATKTFNSQYEVKLLDNYGNPLKGKEIILELGTSTHRVKTNNNGIAKLNISLNPASYNVKIINPMNNEVKTQIIKVVPRISGNKDLTMYYDAGKYYKIRIFDDNGKVAKNVKVTFKIKNMQFTRTTDKNGYVSLRISLNPAKYTINVQYKGFKVSNKITVKSTLVTKNINVKKGKIIKFTVKLLNKKGKILKYKIIKFKFKGRTYKVKTNKRGIATLMIAKKYNIGKYIITTSYGKLKVKNTIKIKR